MSRKSILSILLCTLLFLVLLPAAAQAAVTPEGVFVYDNPNGNLKNLVEADLGSEFGQSSPYNYLVVTSMKITGEMKDADYTFIKNNLKNHLQNLDLSGFSGSFPKYALQGCSSIETVRLPASAPASQGMFLECSSLKTLMVGSGVLQDGVIDLSGAVASFNNEVFRQCSSIEAVRLPAGASISYEMFSGCSSLKTLGAGSGALDNGVIDLSSAASFDYGVFYSCQSIETVRLPAGGEIPVSMFNSCSKLKTLMAGNGAFEYGVVDLRGAASFKNHVFYGCGSIEAVRLPVGAAIPNYMFFGCSSMKTLVVGDGVLDDGVIDLSSAGSFGYGVFYSCPSIETVRLPAGASISDDMFYGCSSLKTLRVGGGMLIDGIIDLSGYTQPSFGVYPFELCSSIETVRLPAGTSISRGMFYNCSSLSTVLFTGSPAPVIGTQAFTGSPAVAYVPNKNSGGYEETAFTNHFPQGVHNLIPELVTETVTGLTASGATLSGQITSGGGTPVTERGFVYATTTNPTIGATGVTQVTSSSGTDNFTEALSGLTAGTTYYVRAYATNSFGTGYGAEVSFTTQLSSDAALSGLAISQGTLSPAFASATAEYTAAVANSVSKLTLTPTTSDATASITVNGMTVASGAASSDIALSVGENTITVLVTAQDGTTTKSYTVTVTRAPSSDAALSGLAISQGTLSPSFTGGTYAYTASVGNSVYSLNVTPTTSDANASITVNGTAVASGAASSDIALSVGANTITILVTAQDNSTQTYTITIRRAASSEYSTPICYTLEAAAGTGGSVSPAGNLSVPCGESKTFTIAADEGYKIKDVLVDGVSVGIVAAYTFNNLEKAHTIMVFFEEIEKTPSEEIEKAPFEETEITNPFDDIAPSDWYYDNILFAYQTGLMVGTTSNTFSPLAGMTRAMFVTVLYRLSSDNGNYANTFSDVPSEAWYENAAAWAAANSIAGGMGGGLFAPDQEITREQLAVMLYNYAKYMGYDVSAGEETNILSYNDSSTISDYAYTALQWACATGIMGGDTSGNLNPRNGATRAEAAAMLQRFIENMEAGKQREEMK